MQLSNPFQKLAQMPLTSPSLVSVLERLQKLKDLPYYFARFSQKSALELLGIQTENQGRSCLVTMVKCSLIHPNTVCVCVDQVQSWLSYS